MPEPIPDLPARSPQGLAALDIFYSDFNDIHFYVEDQEQENLYERVFEKIFPGLRIARVFPLGGKLAVLQHAISDPDDSSGPFKAHILDRDFDYLLNKQVEDPRVFYLDMFCIENHLLEARAAAEVVVENHPKKRAEKIEADLSIGAQIEAVYEFLRPLFLLFFSSQLFDLGIKNSSCPPDAFCKPGKPWELNADAVANYEAKLKASDSARLLSPPLTDICSDPRLSNAVNAKKHVLVSGKFVAKILFSYIKSKYSLGSMTFESFVYRLAKNCALRSMRPLASRVRAAARARAAADISAHPSRRGTVSAKRAMRKSTRGREGRTVQRRVK